MTQHSTAESADPPYRGSHPRPIPELLAWHARGPAEAALEPDLPIVDAHHHLQLPTPASPHAYAMAEFGRDLGGGHRVLGTVHVEGFEMGWRTDGPAHLRSLGEVEAVVRMAAAPLRLPHGPCQVAAGMVSNVELDAGDAVPRVLEAHREAAQGRLRGVRNRLFHDGGTIGRYQRNRPPPGLSRSPEFRRGFPWLERFGLAFDAVVFHPQLGEVIELADAFPHTPIVLNHVGVLIGVAEHRAGRPAALAQWERDLRALAARPNACVKVGGMGITMFGFGFELQDRPPTSAELAAAWQPMIDLCIEAFGPRRCMFESNFPVDRQSCGYTELWNAFKLATRALSADERAELFHGTACRVYRLPELAERARASEGRAAAAA